MGLFSNGDSGAQHNRQELARRQRQAVAQDIRVRGGNPVTVSDVRQRHAAPAGQGRAFLTTMLRRGR